MRNNVVLFKEACSALEAKAFLWLRVNVNKIMLLSVFTKSSWLWTFANALFHSPSDSSWISSSVPPTSDFSFMTGQFVPADLEPFFVLRLILREDEQLITLEAPHILSRAFLQSEGHRGQRNQAGKLVFLRSWGRLRLQKRQPALLMSTVQFCFGWPF